MFFYLIPTELAVDCLTYLTVIGSKLPVMVSELKMFLRKPQLTLCNDDDFTGGNNGRLGVFSFYAPSYLLLLASASFTSDLYFALNLFRSVLGFIIFKNSNFKLIIII